jgi:DNA-binding response OmpR family regulator
MAGNRPAVLVVDDEQPSRELLALAIESWGYDIYLACDGEEAVSIIREKSFPVVITDVVMPRLDGIALLRILRQSDPQTVVILVTAYGTINDAVAAIREGAMDFLTKPLDFRKLRWLVEKSLDEKVKPEQECHSTFCNPSEGEQPFSPPDFDDRPSRSISFQKRNQPTLQQRLKTGIFSLHGGRFRDPGSRLAANDFLQAEPGARLHRPKTTLKKFGLLTPETV